MMGRAVTRESICVTTCAARDREMPQRSDTRNAVLSALGELYLLLVVSHRRRKAPVDVILDITVDGDGTQGTGEETRCDRPAPARAFHRRLARVRPART